MLSLLLLAALVATSDDPPKPKPKPVAMIIGLKGKAEVRPVEGKPTPAEIGDLLYLDEVLVVPGDGSATVSILGAGLRETIKPGTEAKVGPKGCSPPESVLTRKEQPKAVASTMKSLKASTGDARKAGVGFRSGPDSPPSITPILGSTLTSDRPTFAWPQVEKATTYRIKLVVVGSNRELWKVETKETRLDFPADKEALKSGPEYRWEVTDESYHPVASGGFSIATTSQRAQFDELKTLSGSENPADRYYASLAYRRLAGFAEALILLEMLTKDEPGVEAYRRDLAELRRLAGREKPTR